MYYYHSIKKYYLYDKSSYVSEYLNIQGLDLGWKTLKYRM